MPLKYQMIGETFGRLTVLERAPNAAGNQTQWKCQCQCGTVGVYNGSNLRIGITKSCGCLRAEATSARRKTHGKTQTPLYRIWRAMLDRCYLKSNKAYKFYGGRGIVVCDHWRSSYENFQTDMEAGYKQGLWLDRRESNGPYSKENCRWATPKEQQRNRRDNRLFEFRGKTRTLAEIVEMVGINYGLVLGRLRRGWPLEDALNQPANTWLKHKLKKE